MTEHSNIALIGMPGPGKSAAGRLLAEMYGERFALYAARTDITIRTDDMTLEQVREKIIEKVQAERKGQDYES